MGKAESAKVTTSVRFAKPGYYRAVFRVEDPSLPAIKDGLPLQNVFTKELWLFVAPSGGQITESFNVKLIPDSLAPVPGVFRKPQRLAATPSGNSTQYSLTPQCTYGYVTYYNADSGFNEAVKGADVEATIIDHIYGNYTENTQTDESGYYSICPDGSNYAYVDAYVYLRNSNLASEDTATIGRAVGSGQIDVSSSNNPASQVYTNIRAAILATYSNFQVSPRFAYFLALPNDYSQPYAYYLLGDSKIRVRANGMYGEYGRFVAAHEYGHLIQDQALGWPTVADDGGCPSPHYFWGTSSLYCAETEGWGNYFAIVTRGSVIPNYVYDIESLGGLGSTQDGSRVEDAVAAYLYDIGDAANETHDSLALGHDWVARIYDTCLTTTNNVNYIIANGADHLSYCMENTIDSAVTGSSVYFTARVTDPVGFSHSAGQPSGWSASGVRAIWRHDLYLDR